MSRNINELVQDLQQSLQEQNDFIQQQAQIIQQQAETIKRFEEKLMGVGNFHYNDKLTFILENFKMVHGRIYHFYPLLFLIGAFIMKK